MIGARCPGKGSRDRSTADQQGLLIYMKESRFCSEDEEKVSGSEVSRSDLYCRSLLLTAV